MRKPTIKLPLKVHSKIQALAEETGSSEYGFYLLFEKDDTNPTLPFKWEVADILVTSQEVTGGSVSYPTHKVQGRSCEVPDYELQFTRFLKHKKLVLLGTGHKHPISGWSSTDDNDWEQNTPYNLNEKLPFIDIVLTPSGYVGRMRIKLRNGKDKQVIDTELNIIVEADQQAEVSKATALRALKEHFSIDTEKFEECLEPKLFEVDVKKELELIKTFTYNKSLSSYGVNGYRKWDDKTSYYPENDNTVVLKKKKKLVITYTQMDEITEAIEEEVILNQVSFEMLKTTVTPKGIVKTIYKCESKTDAVLMHDIADKVITEWEKFQERDTDYEGCHNEKYCGYKGQYLE